MVEDFMWNSLWGKEFKNCAWNIFTNRRMHNMFRLSGMQEYRIQFLRSEGHAGDPVEVSNAWGWSLVLFPGLCTGECKLGIIGRKYFRDFKTGKLNSLRDREYIWSQSSHLSVSHQLGLLELDQNEGKISVSLFDHRLGGCPHICWLLQMWRWEASSSSMSNSKQGNVIIVDISRQIKLIGSRIWIIPFLSIIILKP